MSCCDRNPFVVHQASRDQILYKTWAKSNNPRLSYWRFSTFSRAILGVGHNWQRILRGEWIKLHQTWPGHRAIIAALHFCFRIQISCCIFKRGRLKVEWCVKRRQILHFLTPCKNYGRGGRDLSTNLKLYLRPNLRNTFDGVAAEHGGLIIITAFV